ncbi:DUF1983 domain-containing protein [Salmonella enterica subsp. enterica]|nr:DUF1983 domain-containing protein [Salmonella enterica subsp. enterica serovar Alachua]EDU9875915.1 DUF1983 domain-containing protein [Salmonella enterica subsp. enterica]EDC3935110.1 DUF1983 domain-containing protein [Salmonella enterica subsp. enterica serovar Alachua]EDM8931862.1 host specificity protein [Salmonella enterica subsp. enterica serovar Alachua]EDY7334015.1 DUF1983 domain-containing protein [Salmonella enterica subsp. enterica serovar Alachua]
MATATPIKGRKGGSSSSRTPTEQPDDLQSVAKAKILVALGEGEFAGQLTGKNIYLDGTALENSDGSQNFSGVTWEFRAGTQAQNYIQGIPGTENEINVGTEVSSATAWTRTFTNTQLSAVRLRLKWPSLFRQEDNGDLVGYSINYAIDLQTDGGTWQTVLNTSVTGKTTSGYERSHRIDLPQAGSTWTIRLRKITADANSAKIGDTMTLQSFTEVIDAKLRYPNTALLYIEFDSSQFNGSIPQISCEPRGRVIRVPDNYDPDTRTYSGTWQGAFKWAWTDNPAWIFYDLVITDRFGLGNRLSAANIDKWTLYQVSQYCDQPVPDGKGGSGTEPRYTCNVYVQDRNDAYTVLRDFAAIFRGMTYWGGDQIVALADMPRDVDYAYTRANVIDGRFTYSSSTTKTRYTTALVSWSDPGNAYADAMEPVFEQPLVARYGFNQLEMTAIGCTRQSEANRKGRWGILTNNKDRVVSFDVGLDGNIPQPGYIIAVSDELLSGKVMGGRISAVNGRVIKLDHVADAAAGDRLILNLPSGASQSRTIQAVNGESVTVTTAYSETPQAEAVWVVESDELYAQQYRVVSVSDNDDGTFSITGAWHDPDKYARIDTGAIIDQRPVSVIPPGNQSPPANIVISSFSVVQQNISVETMRVSWDQAQNAIAYEAQWRRNDGNWVNVPRSSTTSFDVSGIYAGRYLVRVRAINAAEISSGWGYSEEKTLTGKVGNPPKPVGFTTTPINWGIRLNWGFPANTGDTLKTEIQYTANSDFSNPLLLSDVPYPSAEYTQLGLKAGQEFWYRAQLVDRTGNESGWTDWVRGQSNANADDYLGDIADDFLTSADGDRLTSDIDTNLEAALQNALANHATVEHQWAQYGEVRADILVVKTTIADVNQAMAEMSTQVQAQFNNVTAALEDKLTAVVDATGASAIYTLKTGVRINGVMYNAGMSIAVLAEAGKPVVTRVGFNANQFVLMSGSGDTQYSPFAVVNGQVFISDAFIQDASITSAKIKDAAITNAKIGNVIQSNNWDGNNGWMIDKAGNATFNNTTVRGTVYATNGSFSGTIEAKHFVGDIVNAGVGADKIATGDNTVSATIQYTDTSESTTPKTAIVSAMCHMTGSRSDRDTSLGLRIEINGVVKEFGSTYIPPARDVFVPIHWALSGITSRVVTATITLFNNSGLEGAVQKKIIGPTLQIARGSGSFQSW